MPGNFTAKALIMLNYGENILQSYAYYSALLHDDVLVVKKVIHSDLLLYAKKLL